jgi:hypothetical protein
MATLLTQNDMAQVIGTAKAEMDRLIQLGRLQSDPLRHPIEALAVHLDALHKMHGEVETLPDDVRRTLAPVLAQMKAFTVAAEQAATRPLLSSHQIKYDLMPVFLAALSWAKALIGAVVLFGVFWLGWGAHWWREPALTCSDQDGGMVCYVWTLPPVQQVPREQHPNR